MGLRKQLGHSMLVLSALLLAGCQMLHFQPKIQSDQISKEKAASHSESVMIMTEQMDLYLSQQGRDYFLNQILEALESGSKSNWKGKDPSTYAWWKIHVQPVEYKSKSISKYTEEEVRGYQNLEFLGVSYRSKTVLNLRSEPGKHADKLGELQKGEVFNALAKVVGKPWLLVEQKGVIRGYVHRDYVRSNVVQRDILSTQPNPLLSVNYHTQANSEIDLPLKGFFGNYTCRFLNYELTKEGEQSSGAIKACRKDRKLWFIADPISSQDIHRTY
ncbi:SH3 domain-containing protein [Vibrio rotiferianus]|uniref:SH3 domain-containing protein n=1 Tax=Vibrio rotiferianus TaxID=190895 RepID=A0A7Y3Z4P9_9VIBR|nr:SH3 domain-containing protein [Vibrio rotiferianus]NOH46489.1 SH3 domain-containing protein [Vibrio rotiferianus]